MTGILAGFVMGLVGSVHCAAMCGPLAIWMHGRGPAGASRTGQAVRYHAGRLLAYGVLGAIAGRSGELAIAAGFGSALAATIGAWLAWEAIRQAGLWSAAAPGPSAAARMTWPARVTAGAARWLQRRGLAGPLALGAVTGLLPCGLLYAAVAGATGLAGRFESAGFMLAFGLGTSPLLVATVWSGGRFARGPSPRLRRLAPLALLVIAALVLLRGFWAPAPGAPSAGRSASVASARGHVH